MTSAASANSPVSTSVQRTVAAGDPVLAGQNWNWVRTRTGSEPAPLDEENQYRVVQQRDHMALGEREAAAFVRQGGVLQVCLIGGRGLG